MKNKIKEIFLATLVVLICNSCLKDLPSSSYELGFDNTAELLVYLESKGDYINSEGFPSLVLASEVHDNVENYLVIDIRSPGEFYIGHVRHAVNVQPVDLLTYMKSIESSDYQKIIIVSKTGQSAAYFSCLLILDGYTNIYAMRYGMAAWNSNFSSPWLDAIADLNPGRLTEQSYVKPGYSKLPAITFSESSITTKSKLEERINILLAGGFEDEVQLHYSSPVTDFEQVLVSPDTSMFIICLGNRFFYSSYFGTKHPYRAVNYMYQPPHSELKSINALQTIPSNKRIYLYSYEGHASAALTAFLRILGYDARAILFGGNSIIHSAMLATPGLEDYVFDQSDINDFEYFPGH